MASGRLASGHTASGWRFLYSKLMSIGIVRPTGWHYFATQPVDQIDKIIEEDQTASDEQRHRQSESLNLNTEEIDLFDNACLTFDYFRSVPDHHCHQEKDQHIDELADDHLKDRVPSR